MSLCDSCYAPGACCRRIKLSVVGGGQMTFWDDEDAAQQLKARMREDSPRPMPFVPLERISQTEAQGGGRTYSSYVWSCTALLENGRCGIYEERPGLCRRYEPQQDGLCVHFGGAEAGDPSVGFD